MKRLSLLLALGLALLGVAAHAARVPNIQDSSDPFQDIVTHLSSRASSSGASVRADATPTPTDEDPNRGRGRREDEGPAFIAIRFNVPPSLHDNFVDEWQKLEDVAREDKRNVVFALKKTATDNVFWYVYEEWESKRDLMEHFEGKSFGKFKDFATDHDVAWEVLPLVNVTETSQERREMRTPKVFAAANGAGKGKGKGFEDEKAYVLIKYHVPPSQAEDFIDAWEDMAHDTWGEKENVIYSLRKVVTSNTEYWTYGTWEHFDAFHSHFHSKHVHRFRSTIADQGIVWYMSPLEKYDMEKEGQKK